MKVAVTLFALLAGPASLSTAAWAGCPNVCDVTVEPIATAPQPPVCVRLTAEPSTCDCGVSLSVDNDCTAPVEARGFSFDLCHVFGESQFERPCSVVQPGRRGVLRVKIPSSEGIGRKERALQLSAEGADHTVTLTYAVTSFGNGGCAVAGASGSSVPMFALLFAIALNRRGTRR